MHRKIETALLSMAYEGGAAQAASRFFSCMVGLTISGPRTASCQVSRRPISDHYSLLKIRQEPGGLELDISNPGRATTRRLEAQISLGARIVSAVCNSRSIAASVVSFSGDEHANVTLAVPLAISRCRRGVAAAHEDEYELDVTPVFGTKPMSFSASGYLSGECKLRFAY